MKKLFFFWDKLISTFWFIPVFILLLSIGLAIVVTRMDTAFEIKGSGMGQFVFITNADSARSILSTISGAMIGVAGTVFSITLVALTLASSQFGPRLIKNFMYDRLNQIVLGTYIASFIYCLIILNTVFENDNSPFIPSISILIAQVLAIANIILLVVFFHHIAVSIQANTVVSNISDNLLRNLKKLFPDKLEEEDKSSTDEDFESKRNAYKNEHIIKSDSNGYIQYVDEETLIELASDDNGLVEIMVRPGNYIVPDSVMGYYYSDEEAEDDMKEKLKNQFILGKSRTHQQDVEHSLNQLVEIAARALSPGINDPFTAITCIDNLTTSLKYLSSVKIPSKFKKDKDGNLRMRANNTDFEGYLDVAFNQIRQLSEGIPAVSIHLVKALGLLYELTTRSSHKSAIMRHIKMVHRGAKRGIEEPNDLADFEACIADYI